MSARAELIKVQQIGEIERLTRERLYAAQNLANTLPKTYIKSGENELLTNDTSLLVEQRLAENNFDKNLQILSLIESNKDKLTQTIGTSNILIRRHP